MSTSPETFWFHLNPSVYPIVKNDNVLLLNTWDMNAMMFNQKEQCAALMKRLLEPVSFGVLEITSDSDKYIYCRNYIKKICDSNLGVLQRVLPGMKKPAVLTPYHLRIHSTTKGELRKRGSNITLVINNNCSQECGLCSQYYKQFKCCTQSGDASVMDPQLVRDLVQDVSSTKPFVINVCGGNIIMHPRLEEIITILSNSYITCRYHMHYKNYNKKIKSMISPHDTVVIMDFPVAKTSSFKPDQDFTYNFIVTSREDLESCREYVRAHNIDRFYISVVDTGQHTGFLKENVFLLQDNPACGSGLLPFNDRVRIVNNHYFYRTFILPNGDVFGSYDSPAVANMYRNPISYVKGTINHFHEDLWKKTWDNRVCFNCLFQYICPLLSCYDFPDRMLLQNIEGHA